MKLRRGEIWLVELDPIRRGELGKTRPCLIVSEDAYNQRAPAPLIMPITSYPPATDAPGILANAQTGLSQDSSVLPLHIRAVSKTRFVHRIGRAPAPVVEKAVQILMLIAGGIS